MKLSGFAAYALGVIAGAALVAGCSSSAGLQSSSQASTGFNPAGSSIAQPTGLRHRSHAVADVAPHSDHHKSWVSADLAKTPALLFVSDYSNGDVYMMALPKLTLKGTLTGFSQPQSLCGDGHGDVWIPATGSNQIFKYSHAGTLLATLTDPDGGPDGCAVDKTTGNLAVVNQYNGSGPSSAPGEVLIYPHASGSPVVYATNTIYSYWNATYDPQGNLYVDGCTSSSYCTFALAELPAGSSQTLTPLNLTGGTIYFTGVVQWDKFNNNLAIGDQECNGQGPPNETSCVYHASVSGSSVTIASMTPLNNSAGGASCDVDQPVIGRYYSRELIAGPDLEGSGYCGRTDTSIGRWDYPAGGSMTHQSTNAAFDEPVGAAISNR
ncbi:MAG: YncE family protein [Candidatus Cybelea sp.]